MKWNVVNDFSHGNQSITSQFKQSSFMTARLGSEKKQKKEVYKKRGECY